MVDDVPIVIWFSRTRRQQAENEVKCRSPRNTISDQNPLELVRPMKCPRMKTKVADAKTHLGFQKHIMGPWRERSDSGVSRNCLYILLQDSWWGLELVETLEQGEHSVHHVGWQWSVRSFSVPLPCGPPAISPIIWGPQKVIVSLEWGRTPSYTYVGAVVALVSR